MRGLLFIVIIVPLGWFVKGCTQSSESASPVLGRRECYWTANQAGSISSKRFAYWMYWYFRIKGSSMTSAMPV